MAKFGKRSKARLLTCDFRLQFIMNKAIEIYDFSVLEGYRNMETQNRYYKEGASKLKWPKSKHNKIPAQAIDIAPWHKSRPHIRWKDLNSFYEMAGIIKTIASIYDIKIKWGGDWKFKDCPHFELV